MFCGNREIFWRLWPTGWAWTLQELFDLAAAGEVLPISSLCTVFAESEVINYIGEGRKREDIAAGVVDSVAAKVAQLAQPQESSGTGDPDRGIEP